MKHVFTILLFLLPVLILSDDKKEIQHFIFIEKYSEWEPSQTVVESGIEIIFDFLNQRAHNNDTNYNEKNIIKRFDTYSCQFIGRYTDLGEKYVHYNFFPSKHIEDLSENEMFIVWDGGYHFWRISLDLSNNICYDFSVNGN